MTLRKTLLNLTIIITLTSLILNLTPLTLAQNNTQTPTIEITPSISNKTTDTNFDTITMPKTNPQYNGFIAPPNQDPIPVDAIHIQTAQQLAGIGGEESTGRYYVLDNDIDLVGEWVPIDDFRGTFDGQGYSVNNLYVLTPVSWAGLFGWVSDEVVIKNVGVNINPVVITFSADRSAGYVCVGGLVGSASGGVVVENCFVVGDVSVSVSGYTYGYIYVGGLIGYDHGGVVVENCFVVGDVSVTVSASVTGSVLVGGLIGCGFLGVVVENCFVVGDVSVYVSDYVSNSQAVAVGGLVGYGNEGHGFTGVVVENCFVVGDVSGHISGYISEFSVGAAFVGGLVGTASGVTFVENCFVVGDVYCWFDYGSATAGGLVGRCGGFLANCYVVSDVVAISDATLPRSDAGGLVGYGPGVVESCYRLSTKQIIGEMINGAGTPLSFEDMQRQESFVGWDFDTIWAINPEVNGGFPYLRFLCDEQPETFPIIQVSSVVGKAGDEVTLTVTLENNPGIASYSLTMKYPSELEFVCAEQGDILDSNFRATTTVVGQVSVSATSENGADVQTGAVLFTITFKIVEGVEDGLILNEGTGLVLGAFRLIDAVESDGKRVSCVFIQGQVVVKNVVYGDVNGDGVVDFLDVTCLLRYLWEVPDSGSFNVVNADVNGDGVVDFLDVTRLLRYLWEVDPSPLGPN